MRQHVLVVQNEWDGKLRTHMMKYHQSGSCSLLESSCRFLLNAGHTLFEHIEHV